MPSRRQTPTVKVRRLAAELLRLRAEANLTQEAAAELISMNPATLWRIEHAYGRPQRRTLLALLDAYGVEEPQRGELLALLRTDRQPGWLKNSGLPEPYTAYISFEAEARAVWNYESLFVPGLLQTEEYARATISLAQPTATTHDIDQRVRARLQRQALLAKDDPLKFWAIVDEAALQRVVGNKQIMADQLVYLDEIGKRSHITFQVIPFTAGAHLGMLGPFVIMKFTEAADPDLIYIPNRAGDLFLDTEGDAYQYSEIYDDLRARAMSPHDSAGFIRQLSEGYR